MCSKCFKLTQEFGSESHLASNTQSSTTTSSSRAVVRQKSGICMSCGRMAGLGDSAVTCHKCGNVLHERCAVTHGNEPLLSRVYSCIYCAESDEDSESDSIAKPTDDHSLRAGADQFEMSLPDVSSSNLSPKARPHSRANDHAKRKRKEEGMLRYFTSRTEASDDDFDVDQEVEVIDQEDEDDNNIGDDEDTQLVQSLSRKHVGKSKRTSTGHTQGKAVLIDDCDWYTYTHRLNRWWTWLRHMYNENLNSEAMQSSVIARQSIYTSKTRTQRSDDDIQALEEQSQIREGQIDPLDDIFYEVSDGTSCT
jgi:predicted RNA-binding Zn-ribbon protein involved in translation (DUF1610 family)